MTVQPEPMLEIWTKQIAPEDEGDWESRLEALAEGRFVIVRRSGRRRLGVQVFVVDDAEARDLKKRFGGRIESLSEQDWMPAGARPSTLVKVRNRLLVTSATDAASLQALREKYPGRIVLEIPVELAFGTGEHATTATCLRFLADVAAERSKRGQPWSLLDLGTGTGVLAIAAKGLGAERVLGWENDPLALAVAEKNVEAHEFSRGRVSIDFQDVLTWEPSIPAWDVITANMFSGILCAIFPKIRRALKLDGTLIISGILREQAGETFAAALDAGLEMTEVKQTGKWVTATAAFGGGVRGV